jgi:hypothetical protein
VEEKGSRSLLLSGGSEAAAGLARRGEKELSDERVLGGGDFVASVLKELDAVENQKASKAEVIDEVWKRTGLRKESIFKHDRTPDAVTAKAVYCYLMCEKGGAKSVGLMKELKLSSGAISYLCQKGRVSSGGY